MQKCKVVILRGETKIANANIAPEIVRPPQQTLLSTKVSTQQALLSTRVSMMRSQNGVNNADEIYCSAQMEEGNGLVSQIKATIPNADLYKFGWELIDRDQGNFNIKMMIFLWFNEGFTPLVRKRVLLDIQQALARTLVKIQRGLREGHT